MGVTGLWQILHPCARPIKLETLNRKRLAVDASIWIYQFLKAVRDKEGNALRNSHVVGFFRRICKLLFFGIKPVFVFDGGAPVLKRQTVSERKKRREGRREDAVRTAGRLLAVQMQRRAEEEEQRGKDSGRGAQEEEVVPDEALVYVEEIGMSAQERQQTRKFRKKDAYHLPDLDVSMNEMGGPNDPRVMSLDELQEYARQFDTGEDINVYDFSKIDYDSPFFTSLPASDRYNILNAARLRSRLRMGHSKEQLDTMFPDRMAFSKFQIERVTERNELTQRLMHLNEGGDTLFGGGRVAGEKGREYVLVKNDGVEGGWALGVIGDEGTKQETAIDLDRPAPVVKQEDVDWEDQDEFEDVPIEGLNRLPKRRKSDEESSNAVLARRKAFYKSRRSGATMRPRKQQPAVDPQSLFVAEEDPEVEQDEEAQGWEEVDDDADLFGEQSGEAESEELQRAIAMSLQEDGGNGDLPRSDEEQQDDDDMLEVFQQSAVPEAQPIPKGGGRAIANAVNRRAYNVAPESREITSFGVPAPRSPEPAHGTHGPVTEDSDDEAMDLQAALAESRRTKRKVSSPRRRPQALAKPASAPVPTDVAKKSGFSGPLPFEKLDLGTSLLGKKKMQERSEEVAGGFENPELAEKAPIKPAGPLPPWFAGNIDEDMKRQRELESDDRERAKEFDRQFQFQSRGESGKRKRQAEVIDLDSDEDEDEDKTIKNDEVIDLEADDEIGTEIENNTIVLDDTLRMGDIADQVRAEPPESVMKDHPRPSPSQTTRKGPFEAEESEGVDGATSPPSTLPQVARQDEENAKTDDDNGVLDWSESDNEEEERNGVVDTDPTADRAVSGPSDTEQPDQPAGGTVQHVASKSPSVDFEDVAIPQKPASPPDKGMDISETEDMMPDGAATASRLTNQDSFADDLEQAEFDDFSDPEDEELLHNLAQEAEEHARFASTLNQKSQAQNIADYEKELKQLRNQQKKDRRDADEVTHIMIQECQQLLRLFGLPYVTAPMEAEAQCAELVKLGLVDGIVTDDSDCFLFGGTRVYKNMFNAAKFVECYLTSDLEKEFNLSRDKLIQVAHLLGSDYTEGLPSVGPVTALEILGEFQTLDDFKTWWNGVQMNTITKSEDSANPFRKKFRKNATKLFLPPSFPDTRVSTAYLQPEVDSDPEPFQWGVPDLASLRSFLMATIGWSQERTDEVLVPVIKDMNRRADEGTQANITAFFDGGVGIGAAGATKSSASGNEGFAPRKKVAESSKRMGSALTRMATKVNGRSGIVQENGGAAPVADTSGEKATKRSATKRRKNESRAQPDEEGDEEGEGSDYNESTPRKKKRTTASGKPGERQKV